MPREIAIMVIVFGLAYIGLSIYFLFYGKGPRP